jgi:hypothetical protein
MAVRAFPFLLKSRRRDRWLLLFAALAWLPTAWRQPGIDAMALLGLGSALLLCKLLAMRPAWRALVAPLPIVVALLWLGENGRSALAGALAASTGYLAFTLVRRAMYAARAWLAAFRFRMPDGSIDGWDYGQWLVLRERMLSRPWPWTRRRILFPPTDMQDAIQEGFRHRRDRLTFAEATPEALLAHDLAVPLTLADLQHLRGLESLPPGNPLPLPDPACVALCDDKLACNRVLAAAGFAECVPPIGDALPFPYVLKKRVDAWGDNTHVVASAEDERRFAGLLRDPDYFRQAFVPGQREYAAHLLVRRGRIVAALAVEYAFLQPLHKKCREQPPHYRRLRRATHLRLFRDMLAALGYEGLCCVNYKLEDGRVRILEINPRFGASLAPWFFAMVRALPRAARAGSAASRTMPVRTHAEHGTSADAAT